MRENPNEILSDDAIVEMLRAAGIDIARRTVAKYREAMRIPSSVQRRRDKKCHAGERTGCCSGCCRLRLASRHIARLCRSRLTSRTRNDMTVRVSGKGISVSEALRERISDRTDDVLRKYFDGNFSGPCDDRQGQVRLSHRLHAASGFRNDAGSRFDRDRCLCQRRSGADPDRKAAAALQEPAEGSLRPQVACGECRARNPRCAKLRDRGAAGRRRRGDRRPSIR